MILRVYTRWSNYHLKVKAIKTIEKLKLVLFIAWSLPCLMVLFLGCDKERVIGIQTKGLYSTLSIYKNYSLFRITDFYNTVE
jgi:hypothetical protein